jgi:arginyl-tRNA synthetase
LPAKPLERLEEALVGIAGGPPELERPSKAEHGDYATNVALRLASTRGISPRDYAAEIAERAASEIQSVERAEVAGPGFVNIWLAPAWYEEALAEILEAGDRYGAGFADPRERVQVEMVSANPTGPITVASARNGAYGDSVARLLEYTGHEVEREFYCNDEGAQIDLFRASVEARRRGEEPPQGGYLGDYVAELAREEGDPVLRMLERIAATLERFRIQFDTWVRESEFEGKIDEALAAMRQHTYESEGALWLRTTSFGDEKDRVLLRSDGRPTYFAKDAAYVLHKYARGFDRLIYVLGADHHGYVPRLKALAAALGREPDSLEVLIYQLVHLVQAGEQKKVSKRRGDVVFLDDFMDEVGVDAARWYLVSRGPDQAIEIDVDLAAEKTQKNPVYYVQYAHARIAGILRNAPEGASNGLLQSPETLAPEEKALIKRLAEFPDVVAEATERRGPHALPTYAIRVADDFHRFYHEHRVLESDAEAFRLGLCRATRTVIARSLDLVGVEAPERM